MPARWVICPVIEIIINPGDTIIDDETGEPVIVEERFHTRTPLVSKLTDPSTGKRYAFSAGISDGQLGQENDWCICFVRGLDFSVLLADSRITDLLGEDLIDGENLLAESPISRGWNPGRRNRLRKVLRDKNVDDVPLQDTDPLFMWVEKLGKKVNPTFTPRGTFLRERA